MRYDFYEQATCLDPLTIMLMMEEEDDDEVDAVESSYRAGACRTSSRINSERDVDYVDDFDE